MPAGPAELLSINGQRVRLAAWRGSGRVGVLSPLGEGGALGETGLAQALDHCRRRGFVEVLTAAIPEQDLPPFLAAGFVIRERLWLLAHPMTDLVAPPATWTETSLATSRSQAAADWLIM